MTLNSAQRSQATDKQNQSANDRAGLSVQGMNYSNLVPTQRLAPTQRLSEVSFLPLLHEQMVNDQQVRGIFDD